MPFSCFTPASLDDRPTAFCCCLLRRPMGSAMHRPPMSRPSSRPTPPANSQGRLLLVLGCGGTGFGDSLSNTIFRSPMAGRVCAAIGELDKQQWRVSHARRRSGFLKHPSNRAIANLMNTYMHGMCLFEWCARTDVGRCGTRSGHAPCTRSLGWHPKHFVVFLIS